MFVNSLFVTVLCVAMEISRGQSNRPHCVADTDMFLLNICHVNTDNNVYLGDLNITCILLEVKDLSRSSRTSQEYFSTGRKVSVLVIQQRRPHLKH